MVLDSQGHLLRQSDPTVTCFRAVLGCQGKHGKLLAAVANPEFLRTGVHLDRDASSNTLAAQLRTGAHQKKRSCVLRIAADGVRSRDKATECHHGPGHAWRSHWLS